MKEDIQQPFPQAFLVIDALTKSSGFTMASDPLTGTLLRTIAAGKRAGNFLELGTGTGLSTAWILDGMDHESRLVSIDNDPSFLQIAKDSLGNDKRLNLVLSDGEKWINENINERFDYIFADTWHGKYLMLNEVLSMLNKGGIYIVDDMLPQPNWPDGHDLKATHFINELENRNDLFVTKQAWATGIIIAVKR